MSAPRGGGAGRVPDRTRDPGRGAPARGAGAAAGHARPLAGRDVPGRPAARRGGIAAASGRGRVPGAALAMRLDPLDWIVLALYGVVCVAIGLAEGRRAPPGRVGVFLFPGPAPRRVGRVALAGAPGSSAARDLLSHPERTDRG